MKRLLFALCILCVYTAQAQNDEAYVTSLTSEFTQKLQERGIQDYFSATAYCMGNIQMFTMPDGSRCTSRSTYVETYVFWKEQDGSAWIKKIDNCGMYLSVTLSEGGIYDMVKQHLDVIQLEEVKRFETENMKQGRPASRTSIHNCMREYDFHMNSKVFEKEFNLLSLEAASSDSDADSNLNFEHNSNLKLTALSKQFDALIEKLQADGELKRM